MTKLLDIRKELSEKYGYDLASDVVEFIFNAGRIAGIEAARDVLRSSQENCMCREKNEKQFDRLLAGEFDTKEQNHG
jgi:hypothetical protein